jgi:hypothetical protein
LRDELLYELGLKDKFDSKIDVLRPSRIGMWNYLILKIILIKSNNLLVSKI